MSGFQHWSLARFGVTLGLLVALPAASSAAPGPAGPTGTFEAVTPTATLNVVLQKFTYATILTQQGVSGLFPAMDTRVARRTLIARGKYSVKGDRSRSSALRGRLRVCAAAREMACTGSR